jgi:hypothetical protein
MCVCVQAFANLLNRLPSSFTIEAIACTKKPSPGNERVWKEEMFDQAALRNTSSGTARQLVPGNVSATNEAT